MPMKFIIDYFRKRSKKIESKKAIQTYETLSSKEKAAAQNLTELLDIIISTVSRDIYRELSLMDFKFYKLNIKDLTAYVRSFNQLFKTNSQIKQESIMQAVTIFNHELFLSDSKGFYIHDVQDNTEKLFKQLRIYADFIAQYEKSENMTLSYNVRVLTSTTYRFAEFLKRINQAQHFK